jgi:hypothetical protein
MQLDYWIELHPHKKRLVLLYLLQLKTFPFEELKSSCPERVWIDSNDIDGDKIPAYVLRMSEKQLLGELTFCGGAPKWT